MPDRHNPFKDIEELFDRLSHGFEGRTLGQVSVDISETGDELVVSADLPGYEKEDINVSIDDQRLTIRADRDASAETTEAEFHRRERSHQQVSRSLYLPSPVDEENSQASYNNGVLTISLPKRSPDRDGGHSIDIN